MAVDASIYNLVKPVDISPLMRGLQQMAQKPDVEAAREARGVQNQRSKLQLNAEQEQMVGQIGSETLMSAAPLLEQGDTAGALQLFASGRQRLEQAGITPPPSPIMQMLERGDAENAKKVINAQMQRMQRMQGRDGGKSNIGSYNPRDYTTESWAQFLQSSDPSQLKRYESQRSVDIGGVPHVFDPSKGGFFPASVSGGAEGEAPTKVTTDVVADSKAEIASRSARGSESAKLDAQIEKVPGLKAAIAKAEEEVRTQVDTEAAAKKNSITLNMYDTAMTGLTEALSNTNTGPMAGRMPAVTSNQQIAEGAASAMAPILKTLFRTAGEGTFTDKDQELLLNMMPSRKDTPDAIKSKLGNIDAIVRAKLATPGGGKPAEPAPAQPTAQPAAPSNDIDAELQALEQELGL